MDFNPFPSSTLFKETAKGTDYPSVKGYLWKNGLSCLENPEDHDNSLALLIVAQHLPFLCVLIVPIKIPSVQSIEETDTQSGP